jgi:peroxiredoxin family protein
LNSLKLKEDQKMAKKMTIALFSGSVDKLTAAGVILGGAAAEDMDVEIFVLLQAAFAFKKENATTNERVAELTDKQDEFLASLKRLNAPHWTEAFRNAKEMTNVKIHICGFAGKVWHGEKIEDFIDLADDICGIGEYMTAAEESDINLFI